MNAGKDLNALRPRDVKHTCPICGKEFQSYATAICCSRKCTDRYQYLKRKAK